MTPPFMPDEQRLAEATQAQRLAYDPTTSVWVSANAGTGKTTVLTQRILALLLADETLQPRDILALTFTRVAAGEMAERLPKLVQRWAAKSPTELAQEISTTLGLPYTPTMPARLAYLAEAVVQSPPTLTTLHGFAQQVLAALPAVAGLPEGFGLLEENAQKQMVSTVQDELLLNPPETLQLYLTELLNELGDTALQELTVLVVQNWEKLTAILGPYGLAEGVSQVMQRLDTRLALPTDDELDRQHLPTPAQVAALQKMGEPVPADETAWIAMLVKKEGEARKNPFPKEKRKPLTDAEHLDLLEAGQMLATLVKGRMARCGRNITQALLVWAAHVQATYRAAKTARGVVDFADLLRHLEAVLATSEVKNDDAAAAWLWHRLDTRYRHLVIDEAQDNNATQSRIVQRLAANLLAGEVGGAPRTVLAVGDVKQSIYRFQGAAPKWFIDLRDLLKAWAPNALTLRMTYTFRNSPAILEVVNAAFEAPELATATQGEAQNWPTHTSVYANRPARIELWPLEKTMPNEASDEEEPEGDAEHREATRWLLAEERATQALPSAKVRCLQRVARWLKTQHAQGVVLPSKADKPIQTLQWADVLVVVRTNATAQLLAALCVREGIPVMPGVGQTPLAVRDVAALVRVAYNPADTLALAQVLKGLCRYSDAQVLTLAEAAKAQSCTWYKVLESEAKGLKVFMASLPPVCPPSVLVQCAVAWWGLNLAEFGALLSWAEAAEATPNPNLGPLGTLVARLETEDLSAGQAPTQGDGAEAAGGIRILTVHKAKGLEAPLVILPETTTLMAESKDKLLWGEDIVLFKSKSAASALEEALRAQETLACTADALRGLYVGLTRATDWLVVAGWARGRPKGAE